MPVNNHQRLDSVVQAQEINLTAEGTSPKKSDEFTLLKPDPNPFPRYILISLVLQGLGITIAVLTLLSIIFLALRPTPSLIQLADGTPISVKPFSSQYRSPENLKRFATVVAQGLFNWSPKVSQVDEFGQSKLVADSGKYIDSEKRQLRVPTSVWKAAYWLKSDFRKPFLARIAELIPSVIWQGGETYLQIRHVSDPIELSPGNWKVAVIADMVWSDPKITPLEVNKVYYISLSQPSIPAEEGSEFQQTVDEVMRWGLVVDEIKDFKEEKNDFIR
jgi:hypothetical protein